MQLIGYHGRHCKKKKREIQNSPPPKKKGGKLKGSNHTDPDCTKISRFYFLEFEDIQIGSC